MPSFYRTNLWYPQLAQVASAAGLLNIVSDSSTYSRFDNDVNQVLVDNVRASHTQQWPRREAGLLHSLQVFVFGSATYTGLSFPISTACLPLFCNAAAESRSHIGSSNKLRDEPLPLSCPSDASMVLLMAPLVSLMLGVPLKDSDLMHIIRVLSQLGALDSLELWELSATAFGLACMGAQPGALLMTRLQDHLSRACHLPEASIKDLAVLSWSLAIMGGLNKELWSQLVQAVTDRDAQQGSVFSYPWSNNNRSIDEVAAHFLLHTSMLLADGPSEPRAIRAEVQEALQGMPIHIKQQLLQLHAHTMPLSPHVLSSLLTYMHMATVLPLLHALPNKAGPSNLSNSPMKMGIKTEESSPSECKVSSSFLRHTLLVPEVQNATCGRSLAAMAASALDPHEIARVRRELDCSHREDQASKQAVVNEVMYMFQRMRAGGSWDHGSGVPSATLPAVGPAQVSKDLDIVLPHLKTVLLVRESQVSTTGLTRESFFCAQDGVKAMSSFVSSNLQLPLMAKSKHSSRSAVSPEKKIMGVDNERLLSVVAGVDHAMRRQAKIKGWRVLILYTEDWQRAKSEAQKLSILAAILAA
ncbi:hypothetical protein CEUSTIGMA_g3236.t1 [Chlamydomonas eustigma]|uniref:Uncharacterized protein n=1 Tax=Chlamydomonas eustigma TaxID=1157962 RepID=A0A250WY71_9CHLO|nr:hypothetical protein CEUSTIGMA_g3236.t1 [Chlamydomonas eustigma]|eukprot:GAX75793.1 hypothetical protein CEUSTIGMA_g3236.t1 [Chlamydomonas eustigma]